MLTANIQSLRLSLATVSTAPAVIAGVVVALYSTGQTINIQSFIGAIMAIGVAMANAILLVTFAEQRRHAGDTGREAAIHGAASGVRSRDIAVQPRTTGRPAGAQARVSLQC